MGCSSEYPDGYGQDFVPDQAQLLGRIVLAMQAATKLATISTTGLVECVMKVAGSLSEEDGIIQTNREEIWNDIQILVNAYWLRERDGCVAVTPLGVFYCAAKRIPQKVADAFKKEIGTILSRA